jgi:leader peptidase (prepilin peptidase)/N-methyltransferase
MLATVLIAAAEMDRRHSIIPNRLIIAGASLGLAITLVIDGSALEERVLSAVVSAIVLLFVRIGSHAVLGRPGLGMGDVKLAAMMALFLGWEGLWVLYLAVVLGGTLGLLGLLTGRLERSTPLPLAPFVAIGAALHGLLIPPSLVLPV